MRMKFASKPTWHYPSHFRHVATLPWKIESSNFWPRVNCACVPQRFNNLLTPRFVQLFSGNSSVNLFAVYPFKYKHFIKMLSSSLNIMLMVDKHCSDICCDFRCSKVIAKVKQQWHGKFYLQSVWRKTYYFEHQKYQNLWVNNKVGGDKKCKLFAFSFMCAYYLLKIWIFYFPR